MFQQRLNADDFSKAFTRKWMSTFKHKNANLFQQRLNAEYVYCSAPTFWGANHFSFAYERMSTFRDLFIFIFAQAPYRLNPILNPSISSYLIREFKNSLIHEFTNSSAWRRCGPGTISCDA